MVGFYRRWADGEGSKLEEDAIFCFLYCTLTRCTLFRLFYSIEQYLLLLSSCASTGNFYFTESSSRMYCTRTQYHKSHKPPRSQMPYRENSATPRAFSLRRQNTPRRSSLFQTGYSLFKMSLPDLIDWYS